MSEMHKLFFSNAILGSDRSNLILLLLISLFAHIGYNPIEQHNILTIHVNYIKNNILEKNYKKKNNKYIITAKQVKKYCYYITYYI